MSVYTYEDLVRDMACPDCPAEVKVTQGAHNLTRIRVVHAATCPWYARYLVTRVPGCVPCGATVTHRGPYKRSSAAG